MSNKTLVLGDLHLHDKLPGYLCAQEIAIKNIYDVENPSNVIFLGDIFEKRKPTPTELLFFQEIVEYMSNTPLFILAGNHDRETKARNSPTSLDLFWESHTTIIKILGTRVGHWHFIPHFEDEEIIKKYLGSIPNDSVLFGHFGFDGCVNSLGSYDFSIPVDSLPDCTYLGHIHKYAFINKGGRRLEILGTPYQTSFRESGQDKYYGIIHGSFGGAREFLEFRTEVNEHGPIYIECEYDQLDYYASHFESDHKFVMLKVLVDKYGLSESSTIVGTILERYPKIKSVDIKFRPTLLDKEELSTFSTDKEMFKVSDNVISRYVEQANSGFTKEQLLTMLKEIKNETQ